MALFDIKITLRLDARKPSRPAHKPVAAPLRTLKASAQTLTTCGVLPERGAAKAEADAEEENAEGRRDGKGGRRRNTDRRKRRARCARRRRHGEGRGGQGGGDSGEETPAARRGPGTSRQSSPTPKAPSAPLQPSRLLLLEM